MFEKLELEPGGTESYPPATLLITPSVRIRLIGIEFKGTGTMIPRYAA
jgi:hypothetical protein